MSKNDVFTASVDITVRGHLPGALEYLRERLEDTLANAPLQVLSVHAVITRHPDPAATDPVVATATVGLNGRVVHARGRGGTVAGSPLTGCTTDWSAERRNWCAIGM